MKNVERKTTTHPTESELAAYLSGTLTGTKKDALTDHIGSCPDCLAKVAAAHEAVASCGGSGTEKREVGGKRITRGKIKDAASRIDIDIRRWIRINISVNRGIRKRRAIHRLSLRRCGRAQQADERKQAGNPFTTARPCSMCVY